MKKILLLILVSISLTCCGLMLNVPTVVSNGNPYDYTYVYVIPTAAVTSSSGVYNGHGGITKTVSPSDAISGYLMKKGFTPVPGVTDELADKTLIVSYGYTGRRQLGLFAYASCIIIQMRDAKTHQLVVSCESEGCGEDEADDILEAIHSGLYKVFAK